MVLIYNAVPDSKPSSGSNALGRVIGAALVDYNTHEVTARCPHPIILPVTDRSYEAAEHEAPRHSDVAFTGGGVIDAHERLSVFYTEGDSVIKSAVWANSQDLVDYIAGYNADGNACCAQTSHEIN